MFSVWWSYRLAGDIWINRKDPLQGHYCLNDAIKPLTSALFLANAEYVPHNKWLIHMSRSLAWQPLDYENKLKAILDTKDLSLESLKKRQKAIEVLWEEIDEQLCKQCNFHANVHFMQKGSYLSLKDMLQKEVLSKLTSADLYSWFYEVIDAVR